MSDSSRFYACIMAGGSGERFWPMSRAQTPKHLLKLLSDRTLVEETVRRVGGVLPPENIFVLTNTVQLPATRAALAGLVPAEQIVAEPAKRDTAPAAALATALVRARGGDEAVLALLPADAFIHELSLFEQQLSDALGYASDDMTAKIVTFGVKPTFPSTSFGYLEVGAGGSQWNQSPIRKIARFVEKPSEAVAQHYVASGNYLWNAGMFFWRVGTFLNEADRNAPELARFVREFPAGDFGSYLAARFPSLPKISVDYAIMEKARNVDALLARFDWDDVGLWTALPRHLPQDAAGNATRGAVVLADAGNNIAVSNGRTIALCGVKDLVVVETADAVLVCHRDAVQNIKQIVQQLPPELL